MTVRSRMLMSAAFCAACLVAAPACHADDRGWYIGLGAGASLPSDLSLSGTTTMTTAKTTLHPSAAIRNASAIGAVTAGYDWSSNLRLETEASYSDPTVSGLIVDGITTPVSNADTTEFTLFGNLAYDMPIAEKLSLTLGGGVGLGSVAFDTQWGRSRSTSFAFQTISGLSYHWSDRLDLAVDYRFRRMTRLNLFDGRSDSDSHNVLISLRWFLDRPEAAPTQTKIAAPSAPPPPAPPPPLPVKTYIVFFDFNKSYLTDAAQSVITEAVKVAKANGMVKVEIAGHADTVGADDYNMKLSLARAASVKDEMIRQGMTGGTITIEGKGYHEPLVPTGPGVREPQNRRAVIDLGAQ